MLRFLRVSTLVLALSVSAFAGDMQFGRSEPPLPSSPEGPTATTEISDSQEENTSSATEDLQALINLCGYLLPLI